MKTIKENLFLYEGAIYGEPLRIASLKQYIKFFNDGSIGIAVDILFQLEIRHEKL